MKNRIQIIIIVLSMAISIHAWAQNWTTDNLQFLLYPVQWLVSMFTDLQFHWSSGIGYMSTDHSIVIDKSCSGVSYGIIISSLFFLTYRLQQTNRKIWHYLGLLGFAFMLTILVNSFRIIMAIYIIHFQIHIPILATSTFHQFLGGTVYLFSLFLVYYIIQTFKNSTLENFS